MLMGTPYDSDESRCIASTLMSILTGYAYFTSSLIAREIGTFEKYDINKKYMLEVIKNHARVSGARNDKYERLSYKPIKLNHNLLCKMNYENLSEIVKTIWNNTIELGDLYGFRNAQVSVIAPTGTIAFAMDCEATSIEPFFAPTIYKKLAGGGGMSIINPLIPEALENLKYSKDEIEIINKAILEGKIEECEKLNPIHLSIFDTANKCGNGTRYIEPMGHVKMVASLTPMVSGAISKTVNLPKEATIKDMSNVFLESYKLGIKGITCYRDGCKASQPLNTTFEDLTEKIKFDEMKYSDLVDVAYRLQKQIDTPKRDKIKGIRYGKTHPAEIDGVKIYTTVNRRENGEICEIYISTDREGSTITGLLNSLSKSISVMLQHHVLPRDIANMLKGQQYEPNGFVDKHPYIKNCDSISDLISRIIELEIGDYSRCQVKPKDKESKELDKIKTYENPIEKTTEIINTEKNNRIYGKICSNCGSDRLRQNGTCMVCEICGTTTGCS